MTQALSGPWAVRSVAVGIAVREVQYAGLGLYGLDGHAFSNGWLSEAIGQPIAFFIISPSATSSPHQSEIMDGYNRQYYNDRVMTPTPGHQPIYMQVPLNWSTRLTTQVAPRDLLAPGVASPLLIGVASRSGAILESFNLAFVGAAGAAGSFLHVYTRREPDSEISYVMRIDLNSGGAQNISGRMPFLILPAPEQAWRLEPSQEVYVALSAAIPTGLNVLFLGGHYS